MYRNIAYRPLDRSTRISNFIISIFSLNLDPRLYEILAKGLKRCKTINIPIEVHHRKLKGLNVQIAM